MVFMVYNLTTDFTRFDIFRIGRRRVFLCDCDGRICYQATSFGYCCRWYCLHKHGKNFINWFRFLCSNVWHQSFERTVVYLFFVLFNNLKDKQKWMKYWCIAYAVPLVSSFIIFFYMSFEWIAEHEILTYGFFIFFAVNISFRFIVFLVCLTYSHPHDSMPFSFVAEYN